MYFESVSYIPVQESCQLISDTNTIKANKSLGDLVVQGLLAGAYISLAGAASTMIAFNLLANPETFGLGRLLAGIIFPCGLVLVVLAGAELFTGNTMMLLPLAQRRITIYKMLRNWGVVYFANFVGAVTLAFLVYQSGQLSLPPSQNSFGGNGYDMLGGVAIVTAAIKCSFTFWEAFLLGVFCNWLVCLAVWMSIAIKDTAGKILSIFFPIWVFVAAGFEHSIANMYFVPVGLFASQNTDLMLAATQVAPQAVLDNLSWENFFIKNLVPVTLGNTLSGGVFVALVYGYIYRAKP